MVLGDHCNGSEEFICLRVHERSVCISACCTVRMFVSHAHTHTLFCVYLLMCVFAVVCFCFQKLENFV